MPVHQLRNEAVIWDELVNCTMYTNTAEARTSRTDEIVRAAGIGQHRTHASTDRDWRDGYGSWSS